MSWQVYLPVAGVHADVLGLITVGTLSGLFSGAFGVGGTVFSIPILTGLLGVPPSVAVSSSVCQMVASSSSMNGFYFRNGMVETKLAFFTLIGSLVGVTFGSMLFSYLNSINQTNTAIGVVYIIFLGSIASFMFNESARAVVAKYKKKPSPDSDYLSRLCSKLPFKIKYVKSNVDISILVPPLLGFISSLVVSLAGVGSGFILIPSFVYALRLPTSMALGTANFIGLGIAMISTFMQCYFSKTVDILLATILLSSATVGLKFGSRIYKIIPPEELRLILSCIMFGLIVKFLVQMFSMPTQVYSFNFIY